MQKQILEYIEKHLSLHLCGYRKGYSAPIALISMLKKWKLSIGKKGFAGEVLMDLSKAFDTMNHQLLLLHAYEFSKRTLAIIYRYLPNSKQRIKLNVFSFWKDLTALQLYSKDTPTQIISCEYCEICKNIYFEEHLRTVASVDLRT